jgi:hypothetical protein
MGKNGGFDYAYNAQISVDADLQIIVGLHTRRYTNRRTINCHSVGNTEKSNPNQTKCVKAATKAS